ncbi:hypothetical protein PGO14_24240, partial [Klebsiella aerogenes]
YAWFSCSLSHLFCVEVRISPLIRWPNLLCHYTELKAIMAQWAEDKRIEQFFREAESDVYLVEGKHKGQVMERLQLARQLLSVDTAVERLLKWTTPQERLNKR